MVAYNFKKRFVPLIESGAKTQTIRGNRARHARVGEPVQLFFGMRTAHCQKIIPDPVCKFVGPICIDFRRCVVAFSGPSFGRALSADYQLDHFARRDGFDDWADLCRFWEKEHGAIESFTGTLIKWEPRHG